MIDQVISHYQIKEMLGKGGMGEVYKALDTKLKRTVAIKVLRPEAIGEQEAKARFIREARAASALNHPNICTIHDIGEWHGRDFICMEYVEGLTLKTKVKTGPIQLKQVLDIAAQIADALEEAHNKGIVHRDIKSDNVMVTENGLAKVMDFGLAKLIGKTQLTKTGSTLGTVSYMSPEQILGKEVDIRSDIFSFGIVLYEMITGELPFRGEYEAAITYAIVNNDPYPIQNLHSDLALEFFQLINRALEKDPGTRFQTMREVLSDLKQLKEFEKAKAQPVKFSLARDVANKRSRWVLPTIIVSIMSIIVTVFFIVRPFFNEPLPPMEMVPFTALPGLETTPSFSPDGSQIAFRWNGGEGEDWDIYVKAIGAEEPVLLAKGVAKDFSPAWSPDDSQIAFIRHLKEDLGIYTIAPTGGVVKRLYTLKKYRDLGIYQTNLSWSPDGEWLAFPHAGSDQEPKGIYALNIKTRVPKALTATPENGHGDFSPAYSPDGKWLAYIRFLVKGGRDIFIVPLKGGDERRITFDNNHIVGLTWTQNNRDILFASRRGGGQWLWRVSIKNRSIKRAEVYNDNQAYPTISRVRQRLAYRTNYRTEPKSIWELDISQSEVKQRNPSLLIQSTRMDSHPNYSPDGEKIVFISSRTGIRELFVWEKNAKSPLQLTSENVWPANPRWSPDGKKIVFNGITSAKSDHNIYEIDAEGGIPRQITFGETRKQFPSYSRNGKWIYYCHHLNGERRIWKCRLDGSEAVPVTKTYGRLAIESEDGKWIYFTKLDRSGTQLGIWKKSMYDGEEIEILDFPIYARAWVLAKEGIYYIRKTEFNWVIEFFKFITKQVTKIAEFDEDISHIDISKDGHRVIYAKLGPREGDIMLVENFR
ncbi:hypothetical protein BVY01_01980 [bacterium I07]|nr:hypothetical protein BVY01_01980 [bacterium I07]